jgi:hypothetical protein
MEEIIRDYTKLINYFQKHLNCGSSLNVDQNSTSTPSYEENLLIALNNPTTSTNGLDLSLSFPKNDNSYNNSNKLNKSLGCSSSSSMISNLARPTNISFLSPTSEDLPSLMNASPSGGIFILKKKLNTDDETLTKFSSSSKSTKSKSLKKHNTKVPLSLEIINLMLKLDMPISRTTHGEEFLREIIDKRNDVMQQLNQYKSEKNANNNDNSDRKSEQTTVSSKTEQLKPQDPQLAKKFNDAQSDISSCLDSNYESDNNSICGAINLATSSLPMNDVPLETLKECIKSVLHSEDSDGTVNDVVIREKPLSSSNSEKTVTPKSPKSPSSLDCGQLMSKLQLEVKNTSPSVEFQENQASGNADNKVSVVFSRQISDGYSSSYTPLSASSINNEQANINLFFLKPNSSPSRIASAAIEPK